MSNNNSSNGSNNKVIQSEKLEKNNNYNLMLFARNYNFFRIMAKITYGTKADFIKDTMDNCLDNNIISIDCSDDPVWSDNNIKIIESGDVVMDNPYKTYFYYEDGGGNKTKQLWNSKKTVMKGDEDNEDDEDDAKRKLLQKYEFEFKKVILPDGWKMKKNCGCGRNLSNVSVFTIFDENDKIIKSLSYFPNYDITKESFGMDKLLPPLLTTDDIDGKI
jgi:hypothetical protein